MNDTLNNKADAELILSELNFFTKSFNAEPDAQLGEVIAKSIKKFLTISEDTEKIIGYLKTLDEYAPNVENEAYFIELVEALRILKKLIKNGVAKNICILEICEFLERCHEYRLKINNSTTNMYRLTASYITTLEDCFFNIENKDNAWGSKKINIAKEAFSKIPPEDNTLYFQLGGIVYNYEDKVLAELAAPDNERLEPCKKAAHFSLKNHKIVNNVSSLKTTLKYYCSYMSLHGFPFKEEEETLKYIDKCADEIQDDEDNRFNSQKEAFKKIYAYRIMLFVLTESD